MAIKFNRKYELRIGDDKRITDLRMRFFVEYSVGGFIPLCEINLYNLSKTTINDVLLPGEKIVLRAGYENDLPIIFSGEIRNISSVRNDVDIITTLVSGTSDQSFRNTNINKVLDNPKSVEEIFRDLLVDTDLEIAEISIQAKPILGSVSISMRLIDAINKIANDYDITWHVFNDRFYAYDNKPRLQTNRQVFEISSETGLLDVPILTEVGLDIKTLLEPRLHPTDLFTVQSSFLTIVQAATPFVEARRQRGGRQSAINIKHSGDTHSDVWYTEIRGLTNNITTVAA